MSSTCDWPRIMNANFAFAANQVDHRPVSGTFWSGSVQLLLYAANPSHLESQD